MKHLIIGTAGHVDHGKTTLVKALTGIDTDRLREEKERGISIELGFAYIQLPGGKRAGLVDVPGHERFIKNMLAGVGGIDMVLLVIAADEGIMPQTREHLDIVQLLQVERGVVALTKVDMVDGEWIEMVREEVKEYLKNTFLADAPLVEVSAVTGRGLEELKNVLAGVAGEVTERITSGPTRMPVDRVFSITGFGTVVTGTLVAGSFGVGDNVEVMPQGLAARIRSVQVHGEKVERAMAGQRSAVNLTGLEVEQVPRGSVLATPGSLTPSYRMDVKLSLLDSARALKNRARVRVYLGTAEILGRVILLDREELEPGGAAYAQLELEEVAVAAKGDRFVIRSYSPMRTIGGGKVIDPAAKKHKRMRKELIEALITRERGTPRELVEQYLENRRALLVPEEISGGVRLEVNEIIPALDELVKCGLVARLPFEGVVYYSAAEVYRRWSREVIELTGSYHKQYPLREGFPKEELRSKKFAGVGQKQFQALLLGMEREGLIKTGANSVALAGFEPNPGQALSKVIGALDNLYLKQGFQPPAWSEAVKKQGLPQAQAMEILHYLLRRGKLIKVADDIYFHPEVLAGAREKTLAFLREKGQISVGEARDLLGTSRKYALPLLEYFDREKLTRRVGDVRMPGRMAE